MESSSEFKPLIYIHEDSLTNKVGLTKETVELKSGSAAPAVSISCDLVVAPPAGWPLLSRQLEQRLPGVCLNARCCPDAEQLASVFSCVLGVKYTGFPGSIQHSFSKCWPTVGTVVMVSSLLLWQWRLFFYSVMAAGLQAASLSFLSSSLYFQPHRFAFSSNLWDQEVERTQLSLDLWASIKSWLYVKLNTCWILRILTFASLKSDKGPSVDWKKTHKIQFLLQQSV